MAATGASVVILTRDRRYGPVDLHGIQRLYESRCAPILVYSECLEPTRRVLALELGADDWADPDCSDRELAARLTVLMRRSEALAPIARPPDNVEFGGVTFSRVTGELSCADGESCLLPRAESLILQLLIDNAGRPASASQMQAAIGSASPGSTAVHLCRLRGKLRAGGTQIIKRSRGNGYFIDNSLITGR